MQATTARRHFDGTGRLPVPSKLSAYLALRSRTSSIMLTADLLDRYDYRTGQVVALLCLDGRGTSDGVSV